MATTWFFKVGKELFNVHHITNIEHFCTTPPAYRMHFNVISGETWRTFPKGDDAYKDVERLFKYYEANQREQLEREPYRQYRNFTEQNHK